MKIMVSACLLGRNCKYNGGNNLDPRVLAAVEGHRLIPICPEVQGGLSTPRAPAEIVDGEVTNTDGESVDRQFRSGAKQIVEQAQAEGVELAILQPRSPSCGVKQISDGTFTGRLIQGSGVFASQLAETGIKVIEPEDL